jgi:hypothetical protein
MIILTVPHHVESLSPGASFYLIVHVTPRAINAEFLSVTEIHMAHFGNHHGV